jgi:hypothetical protein
MQPTVCRTVLYRLHAGDAEQINRLRDDFAAFNRSHRHADHEPGSFPGRSGHIGHFGNQVSEGDSYPAVVVRTFGGSTVNLKVLLDGNDDYWATSRAEGDEPGQWSWPLLVTGQPLTGTLTRTAPRVTDLVHYVSHGSPVRADGSQAYKSVCRAAIVTGGPHLVSGTFDTGGGEALSLCVLNPEGMFFNQHVLFDAAVATPGDPECLSRVNHGNPFRYCECGWIEAAFKGGTWHQPGPGC